MGDEEIINEDENITYLLPTHKSRRIPGKMSYKEGIGWTIIRLNKYMMREFPQLKSKMGNFNNIMLVPKSLDEIKSEVAEIKEKGGPLPVLLYFVKMRENYK